ncbi:MAG: FhlB domain-containing protein [bacterium]|nr:FhlB domain-containing protein [bacterium]
MTESSHQPPKKAVALRYDTDREGAPRVIAKGERLTAEKILELAEEHGVHVHEDADLVALLAKLDLNAEIPEELYRIVAEVLAFVYRLNQKLDGPGGAGIKDDKRPVIR